MAKDTTTVSGMDNTTPGYLKGKIKDNQTLVGEKLYNDIMQFFQKLMGLAGLVANENYDNETNGYQFVDALDARINFFNGGLLVKEIPIGDWDMNTTAKITVLHGLPDITKIRGNIGVIIFDDFGNPQELKSVEITGTGAINGGTSGISSTTISLTRTNGALFDGASYSTTPLNRGYITIYYLP